MRGTPVQRAWRDLRQGPLMLGQRGNLRLHRCELLLHARWSLQRGHRKVRMLRRGKAQWRAVHSQRGLLLGHMRDQQLLRLLLRRAARRSLQCALGLLQSPLRPPGNVRLMGAALRALWRRAILMPA